MVGSIRRGALGFPPSPRWGEGLGVREPPGCLPRLPHFGAWQTRPCVPVATQKGPVLVLGLSVCHRPEDSGLPGWSRTDRDRHSSRLVPASLQFGPPQGSDHAPAGPQRPPVVGLGSSSPPSFRSFPFHSECPCPSLEGHKAIKSIR